VQDWVVIFFWSQCLATTWPSTTGYFCSPSSTSEITGPTQTCTFDRVGYGICNVVTYQSDVPTEFQNFPGNPTEGGIDTLADYCPYGQSNTLCIESYSNQGGSRSISDLTNSGETYCPDCRCFTSNLGKPTSVVADNRCYNVTCTSPTDLRINVAGIWYPCPYSGGDISPQGYSGQINCDAQLADILCPMANPDPIDDWPVFTSITPTTGGSGTVVNITGMNFMKTPSMSVIIVNQCNNVVVISDTELTATVASIGDPTLIVTPQVTVAVVDAEGRSDFKTSAFTVNIQLNSSFFDAVGAWIQANPIWFAVIVAAIVIPTIILIWCCCRCCKKKKKLKRGTFHDTTQVTYITKNPDQQQQPTVTSNYYNDDYDYAQKRYSKPNFNLQQQ